MSSTRLASANIDEAGPSMLQTLNSNKRTLSEVEDVEGRYQKKTRRAAIDDDSDRHDSKDRKKRKKKKKKLPVVMVAERRTRVLQDSTLDLSLSAQNVKSLDPASRNSDGIGNAIPARKPMSSTTQVSAPDDDQANVRLAFA